MAPSPALVLASASPRRRQLLALLGIAHEVDPAGVEESPLPGEAPETFAGRAARDKAAAVARRHPGRPVLAADTVVTVDGAILGKPRDTAEAAAMLRTLSGRSHLVHTAAALALGGRTASLVDTAEVRFRELDERTIRWYVATGEPLDKAGAYAVQGAGGLLVARVHGSPHTVVGLPLHRLPELFAELGLDLLAHLGRGSDVSPRA